MRRPTLLLMRASCLATGLFALAPAVAHGAFGVPFDLSAPGAVAVRPQVATDSDGDSIVAWTRWDGSDQRAQARRRSAAGALGGILTLSAAGRSASSAQVAMSAEGDAVVVWRRSNGAKEMAQARSVKAGGVLGPIETVSVPGEDVFDPQIATEPDGDSLIVWSARDAALKFRVKARTRSAAGVLGAVEVLTSPSAAGTLPNEPQVAIDADGDAAITWLVYDGSNRRVQGRARSAAGALGPILPLSEAGGDAMDPEVDMTPAGDALFVWDRTDGIGTFRRIQARKRSAAGVLGPVLIVSATGIHSNAPRLAFDAAGNVLIAWQGSDDVVRSRMRSPAGVFGPIRPTSGTPPSGSPDVDVSPGGEGVVVWSASTGVDRGQGVQARTYDAAGRFGPIQTLTPPAEDIRFPRVAVDSEGDALAVWAGLEDERARAGAGP